jgi:hypothetical protein
MKLKAILFALLAAVATVTQAAPASEMISVSTEFIRDGKTLKKFEFLGQNGAPQPYQELTQIGYVESAVKNGKKWGPKPGTFVEGINAVITPRVSSGGEILVNYFFDYQKLIRFDKEMFGDVEVQRPISEVFNRSGKFIIPSGESREISAVVRGVKWQLIITAVRQ